MLSIYTYYLRLSRTCSESHRKPQGITALHSSSVGDEISPSCLKQIGFEPAPLDSYHDFVNLWPTQVAHKLQENYIKERTVKICKAFTSFGNNQTK